MNNLENGVYSGRNTKHEAPFEEYNDFFNIFTSELQVKVCKNGVLKGWFGGLLPGRVITHEEAENLVQRGKGGRVDLFLEGDIIRRIPLGTDSRMIAVAKHKHGAVGRAEFPEAFGGLPSVLGDMEVEFEIVDSRK